MRLRVHYSLLTAMGLGFLALAAFLYVRSWNGTPGLVVEESHRVVNDLIPGITRDIEFCIENRSSSPRRIVGASYP